MNKYNEFFMEFMEPFFEGLIIIFQNLGIGLFQMFNILNYVEVINAYSEDLTGGRVVVIVLTVLCLLFIYGIIIFLIVTAIRKGFKYRRNRIKQEALYEELDRMNMENAKLREENAKFLTMSDVNKSNIEYNENGEVSNKLIEGETRFFRLSKVDQAMEILDPIVYDNEITLKEFCDRFRNYSASTLELYYHEKIIRLFVAAFASNRLIILQGISGTGKTSLAYAFGKMINNEATIASVQPSWRDSSELFGYFNEFTKRYNETEVLTNLYEASYKEDVYITLLDEMNISRVEYYFAEMLSLLELPNHDDWVLDLVPNSWENDPKHIEDGRFKIPGNMWYIGTINNDDSTFMVTDKVYDRAMPINIDDKAEVFDAPKVEPINLSSVHFMELFKKAQVDYKVSADILTKVEEMDRYVIDHFRLAFGNRIVKHIKEFVPVYVACGGSELEGLDYVIANKILRKFEQLNMAIIKGEIDGYIEYMNKLFGENTMVECILYLERLKKTI